MRCLVFALLLACGATAQTITQLDGALLLANGKLALTVRTRGGAMAHLILADDGERISPLHARLGHFVCVDGFGPVSPEERKAGLPGHGEANRVPWELVSSDKKDGTTTVSFSAILPIVQEIFRRTIRMVDGENVIYVDSELESLLGFDRPVNWGEHATIGPPFLELGKTTVEMSSKRGMTRSWESQNEKPHRLASLKEFKWPNAPGLNGEPIDVRTVPATPPIGDHTTSQMDPSRKFVFVTAFHPDKRLLLGYVWRREEYPWTQLWEWYPDSVNSARGLEFAVQPFDMPRREVVQQNSLFDTPTYRWLPAKSKISSAFVMFYTRTPEGFGKVDDVTLEGGKLTIEDRAAGKRVTLAASHGL
jgi:hypothetical protein